MEGEREGEKGVGREEGRGEGGEGGRVGRDEEREGEEGGEGSRGEREECWGREGEGGRENGKGGGNWALSQLMTCRPPPLPLKWPYWNKRFVMCRNL